MTINTAFREHVIDRFHWCVALTPVLTVIIFYSLILHARLILGEWPSRSSINSSELTQTSILFTIHGVVAFLSIVLTSLTPVAWISLLSQAHLIVSLARYTALFLVFLGCLTACLTVGLLDPGSFLNWFLD